MSRLIDADALRQVLEVYTQKDSLGHTPLQLCDAMPMVDAVEVVHGEWMRYGEDGNPNSIDTCIWQCDKCLETYYGRTERIPNYCPNCGAKMDGEEHQE